MIDQELKTRLDIAYEDCDGKSDAYMMQRLLDEVEMFDDSIQEEEAYSIVFDYLKDGCYDNIIDCKNNS